MAEKVGGAQNALPTIKDRLPSFDEVRSMTNLIV